MSAFIFEPWAHSCIALTSSWTYSVHHPIKLCPFVWQDYIDCLMTHTVWLVWCGSNIFGNLDTFLWRFLFDTLLELAWERIRCWRLRHQIRSWFLSCRITCTIFSRCIFGWRSRGMNTRAFFDMYRMLAVRILGCLWLFILKDALCSSLFLLNWPTV